MNKIYQIENPLWLADTFIFSENEIGICFIKINSQRQIEEIGTDFVRRFHYSTFEELKSNPKCKRATIANKKLFLSIGDEYWWYVKK